METLTDVARNGANLRVRAAAIELELAAMNIARTAGQVDTLLARIAAGPKDARSAIYTLGLWAIAASRPIGSTTSCASLTRPTIPIVRYPGLCGHRQPRHRRTVADLVAAFHHDPDSRCRINGGGCGLAHCGMLTRAQRMLAIPGLLEMVEDKAVSTPRPSRSTAIARCARSPTKPCPTTRCTGANGTPPRAPRRSRSSAESRIPAPDPYARPLEISIACNSLCVIR